VITPPLMHPIPSEDEFKLQYMSMKIAKGAIPPLGLHILVFKIVRVKV